MDISPPPVPEPPASADYHINKLAILDTESYKETYACLCDISSVEAGGVGVPRIYPDLDGLTSRNVKEIDLKSSVENKHGHNRRRTYIDLQRNTSLVLSDILADDLCAERIATNEYTSLLRVRK